jgi:hypothetical protein
MNDTASRRRKKRAVVGQVIGESKAEREFQRTLDRWVDGRASYEDVVHALPHPGRPDAMVWLGQQVRRVLRMR